MRCRKRQPNASATVVSFYVYYRVAPEQTAFARDRITHLLDVLAQSTGTRGRLMMKRDEPNLWMEIYEDIRDAGTFESALQTAVAELRIDALLVSGSQRHAECFECA
jgi:hypothetical protein